VWVRVPNPRHPALSPSCDPPLVSLVDRFWAAIAKTEVRETIHTGRRGRSTAFDQTDPLDPSNLTQWAGSGSPITKPSLTAGHTYTFTISASNGIWQGPESAPPSNAVVVS
jgi:hypothetical protein